jgi:predicted Zn-dependent protease
LRLKKESPKMKPRLKTDTRLFTWNIQKILFGFLFIGIISCDKNNNVNFLSVEDDKNLGLKVSKEIEANSAEFPLLDETQYASAYSYLRTNIMDKILNSGKMAYRTEFAWQVKIIKDDSTQNAFCTPGGYIYVYTGLIKYLDTEDQLAGVLGHEVAHADLRHTSRQMTRDNSYQYLIEIITGQKPGEITKLALSLKTLQNSREFETEADAKSVDYLAQTTYACNGAAGFFEKLIANGNAPRQPQWLSTHPNPDNRVAAINKKADDVKCSKTPLQNTGYEGFKQSLP